MTPQTLTIFELAGKAYDEFERRERPDGESYVVLKDSAPEWLQELVRDAHGDFLPDDWRYASIRSALGDIHDNEPDDLDDYAGEWADGNVDVYNGARTAWLSSNLNRAGYCDEALEEFGPSDQGIFGLIGMGQYMESREVFESVATSLRDHFGSLDES